MIIVCAFLPLFAMTGPEGALFGPMANTYAFAIFGALLLAVTLAPVLCSFLFHNKKEEKDTLVDRVMKRALPRGSSTGSCGHRCLTLAVMGGLLAFTVALVPGLGGEFMPELEEGNLWIRALLPRTVSLRGGRADGPAAPRGHRLGPRDPGRDVARRPARRRHRRHQLLQPRVQRPAAARWRSGGKGMTREKIQDELIGEVQGVPGLNFNFSQLIRDNVEEALSGVKGANSVKLFGNDLETLEETGQRVVNILRTVPGIENVGLFHIVGQPNLEIQIDRDALRPLRDQRRRRRGGRPGRHRRPGVLADGRGGEALRHRPAAAAGPPRRPRASSAGSRSTPPAPDGKPGARIPLAQLATIDPHKPGASYIYRENNRRYIPIKFSVRGRDLASAIAEAQRKVDDPKTGAKLPDGLPTSSGRASSPRCRRPTRRLMWMVPLSIVLIMVLLYTAFNSLKDALLVMANVVAGDDGGRLGAAADAARRSASRRRSGSSRSSASPCRTACS